MADGTLFGVARSTGVRQPQTQSEVIEMSCCRQRHRCHGHVTRRAFDHAFAVGVDPGKGRGHRRNPIAEHGKVVTQCSGCHIRFEPKVAASAGKDFTGLNATGLAVCPPMALAFKKRQIVRHYRCDRIVNRAFGRRGNARRHRQKDCTVNHVGVCVTPHVFFRQRVENKAVARALHQNAFLFIPVGQTFHVPHQS